MKVPRRTQADRTAATRAALVSAGRTLFAQHGYGGVGTAALVRAAGVSRGALYHQFGDKVELFASVLDEVEAAVSQQLVSAVSTGSDDDVVAVLKRALAAWLDACQSPDVQRIVLIDGPSVLGWQRWRAICRPHILGLIESVLAKAAEDGVLVSLPRQPLAHILLAIADEAALYLNAADDQDAARREVTQIVDTLMHGLVTSRDRRS